MDRIRLIVGVNGDRRVLDRLITECLEDPECSQVVLQKTGSHLIGPDGREYVVGADGEPRLLQPCAAAEGITSC